MANVVETRVAAVAMVALLATSAAHGSELTRADSVVVSSYFEERFARPLDRDYARTSIEQIEGLEYLSRFPRVRYFVFPIAAMIPTTYVAIAVDDAGNVFELAEATGFNRVVRSLDIVVTSAEDAESLIRDYLRLKYIHAEVWEGEEGGLTFVSSVDDIPWEEGNPEHAVERVDLELNAELSSPCLETSKDGFRFHGFTWGSFSGLVAEHEVLLHTNGIVEYRQSDVAYPYGRYRTGCEAPFDSGPSVDVLARLAARPSHDVQVAVAEYLNHLTSSESPLHEYIVREHRSDLAELAIVLALHGDDLVRVPAGRALSRLERNNAR